MDTERPGSLRRNDGSSPLGKGADPKLNLQSDSQATLSDPIVHSYKAKQANVSPSHSKDRPFRLNLKKKSEIHPVIGDSSGSPWAVENNPDSGKSAKKSLNFEDLIPAQEIGRSTNSGNPTPLLLKGSSSKLKSWYEQTLEEDDEEAVLSPLEARFTNSIRIAEPISILGSPPTLEKAIEDPLLKAPTTSGLSSAATAESQLKDVESLALEWEQTHEDLDQVDLEWTEEDEFAYREAVESMDDSDKLLMEDDLLDDEMKEFQLNVLARESDPAHSLPPLDPGLGRPKLKGKKKKESKKKEPKKKGHLGHSDLTGVVSKKLQLLHGRFSPSGQSKIPVIPKPRHVKNAATPHLKTLDSPKVNLSIIKGLGDGGDSPIPPEVGT